MSYAALAVAAGTAIYQGYTAYSQKKEGEQKLADAKSSRPIYQTPNELFQNLDLAKSAYLDQRLPGQGVAENKLQSNTSQAVQLAQLYGKSPSDIAAVIAGTNENENRGFNDLSTKAAEFHVNNLEKLKNANSAIANGRNDEFNINHLQPYNQDRQYALDLIGAGNQNTRQTLSDTTALATLYNKFFPKGEGKGNVLYTGYSTGNDKDMPDPNAFNFNG